MQVYNHSCIAHNQKAIITQLQKEILSLQGFKHLPGNLTPHLDLGPIDASFPTATFPIAAIHEFIITERVQSAATAGFASCLISSLMNNKGICIWVSSSPTIFPPALKTFGIDPGKVIYINAGNDKDNLWVIEECLKCNGVAAVVGEIKEFSFTASRRLQLAVEQSRVTGFIIRHQPRNLNVNACVTRWCITSLASEIEDDVPGVGFPRWNVELLKIRNGKPGKWQLEWRAGSFHFISSPAAWAPQEQQKQTG